MGEPCIIYSLTELVIDAESTALLQKFNGAEPDIGLFRACEDASMGY